MNKTKSSNGIKALPWAVLGLSILSIVVLLITPHYVRGDIDDVCPAGMVKKGYSFQNGEGTLECIKSSYYTLQQQSPKMFFGAVVGLILVFCFVMARRPHVFQNDNIRLGIRTKQ